MAASASLKPALRLTPTRSQARIQKNGRNFEYMSGSSATPTLFRALHALAHARAPYATLLTAVLQARTPSWALRCCPASSMAFKRT